MLGTYKVLDMCGCILSVQKLEEVVTYAHLEEEDDEAQRGDFACPPGHATGYSAHPVLVSGRG